jgi:Family of unknown function (DUF6318)
MQKQALASLLAAAVALTLSSCDNSGATPPSTTTATTPTTTPSSPTPSATPKPPPPTIPPAATNGLTVTSAEAFARFYLAATDHLVATGDSVPVRRWAMPSCQTCRALADSYERTYRSGGAITGSTRTQIVRVVSVDLVAKDKGKAVFNTKVGASVWRPSAHASPTPLSGGDQRWEVYLSAQGGHWMTQALKLTE